MSKTLPETRTAIWQAIADASGLEEEQVFFADQPHRPPNGPFVTIRTVGPLSVNGPKTITHTFASSTLTRALVGQSELLIDLQAFSLRENSTEGDGLPYENSDPHEDTYEVKASDVLDRIQRMLQLPGARATLRSEGECSLFDFGQVQDTSGVYGGSYESRATLSLRANVVQSASETVDYVEGFEGTLTLKRSLGGSTVKVQSFESTDPDE